MNPASRIHTNIKRRRVGLEMSQSTLASLINIAMMGDSHVTATSVSNWETGKFHPKGKFLPALAKSLKLSIDSLYR